jgi:hypothetical protein
MDNPIAWETIETAPFGTDLELAVIEDGQAHPLVFACRRDRRGWIKATTGEQVAVRPTHWRPWALRES